MGNNAWDSVDLTGHPSSDIQSDVGNQNGHNYTYCNETVQLKTVNWDKLCQLQLESGVGFRITEPGKTDLHTEAGMYSIHSPLYGTEYQDNNAFEDRYSCRCGKLQGKHYADAHTLCPDCKTYVEFVDIDMRKTGWIILDNDQIIQPEFYKKIWAFLGTKRFPEILEYVDEDKREPDINNPYKGIGIIEFRKRFEEIMAWGLRKNKKKLDHYEFIMSHISQVFAHCIPVYNMHLRQFAIRDGSIKYSKEDVVFRKIYSDHNLLNSKFVLARRVENRAKRAKKQGKDPIPGTVDYLRRENITYSIQKGIDALWELSFQTIDKKDGLIRDQILGGRNNYTARNVIIPDADLEPDQIGIGYITALELYKLEIVKMIIQIYQVPHNEAWEMWEQATMVFDKRIYDIMINMIHRYNIIFTIGRNPAINYGSMMAMRLVDISSDIRDHCMRLPELILSKPNADFDGDIMFEAAHPDQEIAEIYYEKMNPYNHFGISRNDGLFDMDIMLRKDHSVSLYAFLNYHSPEDDTPIEDRYKHDDPYQHFNIERPTA